jgi:hypothetical protein
MLGLQNGVSGLTQIHLFVSCRECCDQSVTSTNGMPWHAQSEEYLMHTALASVANLCLIERLGHAGTAILSVTVTMLSLNAWQVTGPLL